METPEQTQELKELLMSVLMKRKNNHAQTIVYAPASIPTPLLQRDANRKDWEMAIRNVYSNIQGFYTKPRLFVRWNIRGECLITFTD